MPRALVPEQVALRAKDWGWCGAEGAFEVEGTQEGSQLSERGGDRTGEMRWACSKDSEAGVRRPALEVGPRAQPHSLREGSRTCKQLRAWRAAHPWGQIDTLCLLPPLATSYSMEPSPPRSWLTQNLEASCLGQTSRLPALCPGRPVPR